MRGGVQLMRMTILPLQWAGMSWTLLCPTCNPNSQSEARACTRLSLLQTPPTMAAWPHHPPWCQHIHRVSRVLGTVCGSAMLYSLGVSLWCLWHKDKLVLWLFSHILQVPWSQLACHYAYAWWVLFLGPVYSHLHWPFTWNAGSEHVDCPVPFHSYQS